MFLFMFSHSINPFFFSLLIKHRMQQTRSEGITLTESEERDSTIIKLLIFFFTQVQNWSFRFKNNGKENLIRPCFSIY